MFKLRNTFYKLSIFLLIVQNCVIPKNIHISKRQIKQILFKNEQVILAEHVFAYCELVTLTPYIVGHKKIE